MKRLSQLRDFLLYHAGIQFVFPDWNFSCILAVETIFPAQGSGSISLIDGDGIQEGRLTDRNGEHCARELSLLLCGKTPLQFFRCF